MTPTIWHGCYEANWKGVITPESFAHPAKYSRALIERIFQHVIAQGYVRRGDLVGDCFGGIATGGIIASYAGLRWIGCELEPRFVAMADANFELHKDKWTRLGKLQPTIVQGDSRKFDEVVGVVAGVVCSPPYSDIAAGAGGLNTKPATKPGQQSGRSAESASQSGNWSKDLLRYGKSEGQISRLKEGSLSAVVTSPPFTQGYSSGGGINVKGYGPDGADKVGNRTYQGTGGDRDPQNIEVLPAGQLAAVVTSPPYADSVNSEQHGIDFSKARKDYPGRVMHEQRVAHADKRHTEQSYGRTEGQIGALRAAPLDAVVTSPPYENGLGHGTPNKTENRLLSEKSLHGGDYDYGNETGNIARTDGETYWQAMAQVYAACHRAIKPGGVICVVVKDYVKNKQRVPLCDDTARLLEHVGFTVVERIHAMLVKETTHNDLFNGTTKTKTERKSFFRRLAEKKGSPEINWEEVIVARKP